MKLCEVAPSVNLFPAARLKKIAKDIASLCGQYLKEVEDPLHNRLYRGLAFEEAFKEYRFDVGHGRAPRDTSPTLHRMLGEVFEEKFGFNYRGDVLFATGNYELAHIFSHDHDAVAVVFPIGKYEYLWSGVIEDFTNDYAAFYREFKDEAKEKDFTIKQVYEHYIDFFKEKRLPYYHHNNQLVNAINLHVEIMIKCDSYIAIPRYLSHPNGSRFEFYREEFFPKYLAPLL